MTAFSNSSPAMIGNTTFHDVVSNQNGLVYRVFVYRPGGEPPSDGWPVLYMTDGNAVIGTAVDAMRAQASYPSGTNVAYGVIVTIGYPVDGAYDPLRRSWDLGPPPGQVYPPFYENTPEVRTGGVGEFLTFIEDQIKPMIEADIPIDRNRQAIFGHSFGGLFVLYSLFTRPSAFTTWIAASASIYWENCAINAFLPQFEAAHATRPGAALYLSCGEYETDKLAPFQRGAADEADRLAQKKITLNDVHSVELMRRLNALPDRPVRTQFEIHAGENHMSLLPVAVNRAIQAAFAVVKPCQDG
ncbi:alpha/beta hydrolase [Phyllobacterium calauticae]|jgi:predicted alpha/beta superfamily hydrolase|uniref:alpha/beta hydrolase n=1 Tax=Phyllobacterium calauticae TaxID=2817027 RepID=UPI001CBB88B6|nr:alpha/beta hydrolase-fold protein [Phyllobacterium calauticae]MBZ3694658.1 alpha/beta hydrolase [Phyllobacterium calauticae]